VRKTTKKEEERLKLSISQYEQSLTLAQTERDLLNQRLREEIEQREA